MSVIGQSLATRFCTGVPDSAERSFTKDSEQFTRVSGIPLTGDRSEIFVPNMKSFLSLLPSTPAKFSTLEKGIQSVVKGKCVKLSRLFKSGFMVRSVSFSSLNVFRRSTFASGWNSFVFENRAKPGNPLYTLCPFCVLTAQRVEGPGSRINFLGISTTFVLF